jgi:hypothetical protein
MSFSDFKNKSQNSIEELTKQLASIENKKSYKDDRFWRPQLDKSSNGFAIIRFLPARTEDDAWVTLSSWDINIVKIYTHAFQGKGGWYIENCRTTLGENDPCAESNSELWNSGFESDKDIARQRKRKTSYISNVLVISDPSNPENEGKVFLYKYGKKIFDKIQEAAQPEFDDEEKINPFNPWSGANFKLKIRKVAGYVNYDKSEFDSPTELFDGDNDSIEEIIKKEYDLTEFSNPNNFKSYDDLKERFNLVVGDNIRDTEVDVPTSTVETAGDSTSTTDDTEQTDALDYFERLASE